MWTIFKGFIEFVTALFPSYGFWSFSHEACGILAPQPTSPALGGQINMIYFFFLSGPLKCTNRSDFKQIREVQFQEELRHFFF